jgi:hypothetical protein
MDKFLFHPGSGPVVLSRRMLACLVAVIALCVLVTVGALGAAFGASSAAPQRTEAELARLEEPMRSFETSTDRRDLLARLKLIAPALPLEPAATQLTAAELARLEEPVR